MLVKDVIRVIEDFAPLSCQESWDNSGLCIGSPQETVTGVLLGLDPTEELVDEAIRCGANLVVTHHPLIFSGLKKISPDSPLGRTVIKAISHGISIYGTHTSADKVIGGVSFAMASRLGLEDVTILDKGADGTGLGVVGNLPRQLSCTELVASVKEAFNLEVLKCSRPVDVAVRRVALCGGSGSSLIAKAMESGAQAYITGDVSYHHFFTGDDFFLMDIGHYESEIDIVDILFSLLRKNFSTFAVRITQNAHGNPVYYY